MSGQYPTGKQLKNIKERKIANLQDYYDLMQYCRSIWNWGDNYVHVDGDTYTFITGGWSGNESIISALQKNYIFWMLYWQSSERGGRYVFKPIGGKNA